MAKFRPAGTRKKARKAQGLIPCLILLISGMALLSLLFWALLRSGTT